MSVNANRGGITFTETIGRKTRSRNRRKKTTIMASAVLLHQTLFLHSQFPSNTTSLPTNPKPQMAIKSMRFLCNCEITSSAAEPSSSKHSLTLSLDTDKLLTAIKRERDPLKSLRLFGWASKQDNYIPNPALYEIMICRLGMEGHYDKMRQVFTSMASHNLNPTEEAFRNMIRSYIKGGMGDEALQVLNEMEASGIKLTTICYNHFFSFLVRENKLKIVDSFFSKMKSSGVPPNNMTFNILVKGLCNANQVDAALKLLKSMQSDHGLVPDKFAYTNLIRVFINMGRMGKALDLLKQMDKNGCAPDIVTFSVLLHGFCEMNKMGEAMELLEEMTARGICPDNVTWTTIIKGFCKAGKPEKAMDLLEKMIEDGIMPNVVTYTIIILGLCKARKFEEAMRILNEMVLRGCVPDVITYNTMIDAMLKEGRMQEAMELYDELISKGHDPNYFTYLVLSKQFCRHGDLDSAVKITVEMIARGFVPESGTSSLLMKRLCKEGRLDEAMQLRREMEAKGCFPNNFDVTNLERSYTIIT